MHKLSTPEGSSKKCFKNFFELPTVEKTFFELPSGLESLRMMLCKQLTSVIYILDAFFTKKKGLMPLQKPITTSFHGLLLVY
jgi:hypothetical protein